MLRGITVSLTLSIIWGVSGISRANDQKNPVAMSVGQLCSKVSSDDSAFARLKGTELVLSGSLSSIGDKRKAFLGNNINFLAELIISPTPKRDPYGKAVTQTGCTVTCLLSVPGEQCEQPANGEFECKRITSPKLEENERTLLKLRGGDSLTVRGILRSRSRLPQYSNIGDQVSIVNFVLSGCEIIDVGTGNGNGTQ